MFIGIAPGFDEQASGRPLTGPSGQLFDATLEACRWSRDDIYATNLICWFKNEPNRADISRCADRLSAEINLVRPKLIVLLGSIVTEAFFGEGTFTWRRARTTWDPQLGCYVLPTYHPAAVLRGNPYVISDIVRDLKKVRYVMEEFDDFGNQASVQGRTVTSIADGQSVLDNLPRRPSTVALDIETNYGQEGIDVFSEDLLCVGLSWGWMDNVVIPGPIAKSLDWSRVAATVDWVLQNGIFDWGGIRKWCGVSLRIAHDTMYSSYMLDERQGVHRLELLGGEDCAADMWKQELRKYDRDIWVVDPTTKRRKKKTINETPPDVLYDYNAKDGAYTWRVNQHKLKQLEQDNVSWPYHNIMIPAENAFAEIQYRGCYVNRNTVTELGVEWIPRMFDNEERLQRLARQYGWKEPHELNIGSTKDMAQFLYDPPSAGGLGLPIGKKTPGGKPSTDHDTLELLYTLHEFPREVVLHRQLAKVIGTYLNGIDSRVKVDGMLHAEALLHGAETGRLSYHEPNLQNIPQDYIVGADLARVRELFEGCPWHYDPYTLEPLPERGTRRAVVLEADYKQIELWVAYFYSGDRNMKEDLDSGDFHRKTAMSVYHKSWEQVLEFDRFRTKMVTFGRMYRRGAKSLTVGRSSLQCTVAEAEDWIVKWTARYWEYELWAANIELKAQTEGAIVSATGRKRRYPLVMGAEAHHMLRSAINYPIQSTASDYTLTSLSKLHWLLKEFDSYVMFTVHDSIVFDINADYFEEAIAVIQEVMEAPRLDWPTPMPSIKIDLKSGPNWGKCLKPCKTCNKLYPLVIVEELSLPDGGKVLKCTTCQAREEIAA